ncbi:MAG: hypothetical protein J1F63_01455 [Oscillospiraceae bacterium]|nr:hypothetical protein [Oscillospiraceae bacterium]
MNEKLGNALKYCEDVAEKYEAEDAIAHVRSARKLINSGGAGAVAFIGQNSETLVGMVKDVLASDKLEGLSVKYVDKAFRLRVCYGDEFSCRLSGANNEYNDCGLTELAGALKESAKGYVPDVEITLPEEKLKLFEVKALFTYNNFTEYDWNNELDTVDFAFLVTNATMAMNSEERSFAEKHMSRVFGPVRSAIVVNGMYMLNSTDDQEAVLSNVKTIMKRLGLEQLFTETGDVAEYIYLNAAENLSDMRELRDLQIVRNSFEVLDKNLAEKQEAASIDSSDVEELIQTIEEKRGKIVARGIVSASNVYTKIMSVMNMEYMDEVEKYNAEIIDNIRKGIDSADDITLLSEKIPGYIETSWNSFEQKKRQSFIDKVQSVVESAYSQMELDADAFFDDIQGEQKVLLERVVGELRKNIDRGIFDPFEQDAKNNISTVSKVMLIAALPAALIMGPLTGIVTAAGAIALSHYGSTKLTESNKKQLIDQAKNLCNNVKIDFYNELEKQVEAAASNVREAVSDAYKTYCDKLIEKANSLKDSAEKLKGRQDEIAAVRSVDIANMMAELI